MHPNEALIHRFYACFQARDAGGMQACYHPEVTFRDPAFGELDATRAVAMWQMLCARAADLDVQCSDVRADGVEGSAHWTALYTFSQTGRRVHNRIDARFAFRDGLIVRHEDSFSFWRWSRQALGPVGLLLGWTPLLRSRVSATANRGLARYMRGSAPGTPPTS
jgi:ketosteroid isomerase-like protein